MFGGGGGLSESHFFMEKHLFLISCFLRVFMLFPTFFENNYFAGMGGGWLLCKFHDCKVNKDI